MNTNDFLFLNLEMCRYHANLDCGFLEIKKKILNFANLF